MTMADLKDAILDAKYVEMISLADYIVRDCALPDVDAEGNLVSGQQEIAAAIFRWAVSQQGQVQQPQEFTQPAPIPMTQPVPVQNSGFAPVQDTYQDPAPMPINTGFVPNSQG